MRQIAAGNKLICCVFAAILYKFIPNRIYWYILTNRPNKPKPYRRYRFAWVPIAFQYLQPINSNNIAAI